MKNIKGFIRTIAMAVAFIMVSTSSIAAKSADQIEVLSIEKIEMKGLTEIQLTFEVRNNSKQDMVMDDCSVTLKLEGDKIATLTQVAEARAEARTTKKIATLWRIENIEGMNVMMLALRVSQNNLEGMSVDISTQLSSGKSKLTIAASDVDITKYAAMLLNKEEAESATDDKKKRK